MDTGLISNLGIDPAYLLIFLFGVQVLLFILLINVNLKYNRLKVNYASFMKGKDGKNLEESFLERFKSLDEVEKLVKKNEADINEIRKQVRKNFQKVGIVRYDAFQEMGGNLSFVVTMLDEENSGWILNAMHGREGCYTYIKEIVRGQSYIELGEEEKESLERAIFQEIYDIRDANISLKNEKNVG